MSEHPGNIQSCGCYILFLASSLASYFGYMFCGVQHTDFYHLNIFHWFSVVRSGERGESYKNKGCLGKESTNILSSPSASASEVLAELIAHFTKFIVHLCREQHKMYALQVGMKETS